MTFFEIPNLWNNPWFNIFHYKTGQFLMRQYSLKNKIEILSKIYNIEINLILRYNKILFYI